MTSKQAQMKPMPNGMRIGIAIVFFLLTVFFAVSVIDSYMTSFYLSSGGVETNAGIISKKTTHNKYGYRYYVTYTFSDNGREYHRSQLFGLFAKDTEITKSEYEQLEAGSAIPILYYGKNPSYNCPKNIIVTSNKNTWFILGILVFGAVSLNEFRHLFKRKFSRA